ncbi:hypothetical protein CDL15_Pgr025932 [Punica granatum]|uniref:DDE Tnp4 domain-containing protein n=1 Tax=Punica granatum TaxID=22663 RepID=A0A218WDD2_PUNGR|nr:hypothetical protein CDL15_Pgr025932 [Punica granatum]
MPMGPVRGGGGVLKKTKRRRKNKNSNNKGGDSDKVDSNVTLLSAQPRQSFDWWDDFSKRITGPSSQSGKPKEFESIFRISRKTFDYICSLVGEELKTKPSNFTDLSGEPLSLNDQVAVALRRLNSGKSLTSIGESFKISQSTVSHVTWRFVEAMEERGISHLYWPSDEAEIGQIKSKFEKIRGLPNCCGAIDTTHILMNLSNVDGSNDVWYDREKNCSMVLQVIVDPDLRFRDIITGWPGKLSDATILKSSGFYGLAEEGKRLNGKKASLFEGTELREYIVGDSGFPLLPWLLTPFKGKARAQTEDHRARFNRRHFATRIVAQRALARLKEMWKMIGGVMWMPDRNKLPRIIFVCCLLHNIIIDLEDEVQDEMVLSHEHDAGYRQQVCDLAVSEGSLIREKLSLYLSGKLPP